MFGRKQKDDEQETTQKQDKTASSEEQINKNLEQPEEEQKVDSCQSELAAVKDQLVRLGADFQNYKRRTEKDRSLWSHSIQADVFTELLPVVDDFDRALAEAQKGQVNDEFAQWLSGFEMIHKALYDYLKKHQVEPIEQNTTFDPELHEALLQVDSKEHTSGDIVQVMQKGFTLQKKVLRPAKVSVAK